MSAISSNLPILAIMTADENQTVDGIITNIRNSPIDTRVFEFENMKIFIHNVRTKYYETQIALLPVENLESAPEALKNKIEGIITYFNPKNRSFLANLSFYKDFIVKQNIEFSILLCTQLEEDVNNGITFADIKQVYNKFDIIELEKAQDEEPFFSGPSGYEELKQAIEGFKIPTLEDTLTDNDEDNDENSVENLDNELENFENLLTQVMQFRPNTADLSREDRLNCAQNFAEVFEKLIIQDTDVSNE